MKNVELDDSFMVLVTSERSCSKQALLAATLTIKPFLSCTHSVVIVADLTIRQALLIADCAFLHHSLVSSEFEPSNNYAHLWIGARGRAPRHSKIIPIASTAHNSPLVIFAMTDEALADALATERDTELA